MSQEDNSFAGRWTVQQHDTFLLGLQLYGKNWKKIEGMISTRTCAQIRSHAQKHFLKLKRQTKSKPNVLFQPSKPKRPLPNLQTESFRLKQESNFSYFMNKIVQFTRSHQQLDIWDALIDSGVSKETVAQFSSQQIQNATQLNNMETQINDQKGQPLVLQCQR